MDGIAELEIDTKPITISTIGKVSPETVACVDQAVRAVFRKMRYQGKPPETVSISQGAVVLPSKEEVEACYTYNQNLEPGKILVSSELSKIAFGESSIPTEVATAAFAAHEAAEHVSFMRGESLLSGQSKISTEIHAKSETDQEANRTAREVISELYGWEIYFGDET